MALGAAYGTLELSSAVSGKDWLTSRELGTGERWLRWALAPLDIVPGVAGLKKFGTGVRLSNQVVDMGQLAVKPGLRSAIQREITHVGDMLNTAGAMTVQRVKNAGSAVRDASRVARDKVARDIQDVGRLADSAVTSMKDSIPGPNAVAAGNVGRMNIPSENTHFFENKAKEMFSRAEGVGVGTVKGTGNTVNDYLDDIIVNGDVDAVRMNKLKNAIQNNTFNVDELSEIRKRMSELGISKKYDEALIKIDFGKYLRGLIGDPPAGMVDPHAHHILFKKGLGDAQQKLVQEGQDILRKYGIEPVIGKEYLVWAPNRIAGQHSIAALENVVNQLKAVDAAGADLDDMIEILEDLGKQAASRR